MSKQAEYWYTVASNILRAEMTKRKISYQDLVNRLRLMDIHVTNGNLRARVSKGAYSAALLFQCLRAMGVKNLSFDDCYFEHP